MELKSGDIGRKDYLSFDNFLIVDMMKYKVFLSFLYILASCSLFSQGHATKTLRDDIISKVFQKSNDYKFENYIVFSLSNEILIIHLDENSYRLRKYKEYFNYDTQELDIEIIYEKELDENEILIKIFNNEKCPERTFDHSIYSACDANHLYFLKVLKGRKCYEFLRPIVYDPRTKRRMRKKRMLNRDEFKYLWDLLNDTSE